MSGEKKMSTTELAQQLMEPIVEELGLEIWDIRFEKEGNQWYLRYFLDKPGGINIIDCEAASRAVGEKLDELDPIKQNYILEVGSPGIERMLKTDSHFQQYIDHSVLVRLIRPVDGVRNFVGKLVSKDGQNIIIEIDEELTMTFEYKEAAFVKLHVDFEI